MADGLNHCPDMSVIDFLRLVRSMGGRIPLVRMEDIRNAEKAAGLGYVQRVEGANRVRLTGLGQSVLDDLNRGGA